MRILTVLGCAALAFCLGTGAASAITIDPMTGMPLQVPGPSSRAPVDNSIPREIVPYQGPEKAGTILVETGERRLYYVMGDGRAMRYGIGVARPGFEWSGTHSISMKREWPDWTPPAAMRERQPHLPVRMAGGLDNPLGARALYLGSTLYRIHGSSEPWSIGQAVSSGCIRMLNEDVVDLYERVGVGTRVIVR